MTHYNYRSLAAETTSWSEAPHRAAYTAYSGLQGAYAITTGIPRLLQGAPQAPTVQRPNTV
jgi:hypothetical protein